MSIHLPQKSRTIDLKATFTVEHPDTQRPIQCKALTLQYDAEAKAATLDAVFTIHARSLRDIQQLFGVLPADQKLKLTMKPEVLTEYHKDFFEAKNEQAFLAVGTGACFFLQNYTLTQD